MWPAEGRQRAGKGPAAYSLTHLLRLLTYSPRLTASVSQHKMDFGSTTPFASQLNFNLPHGSKLNERGMMGSR